MVKKNFVIKLDFFPESNRFLFKYITPKGIFPILVDKSNIIPTTFYDYRQDHKFLYFAAPHFLDMEMIYFNYISGEYFLFDKEGKWKKEGVKHPKLSLDENYCEQTWMEQNSPFRV